MIYDVIYSLLVLIEKLVFSTNSFKGLLYPKAPKGGKTTTTK